MAPMQLVMQISLGNYLFSWPIIIKYINKYLIINIIYVQKVNKYNDDVKIKMMMVIIQY